MYNKLLLLTDLLSNNEIKQTSLCFKGSWSWNIFCNRPAYNYCNETKFELSKHISTQRASGTANKIPYSLIYLQASPKSLVHSQNKLHYKVQYIKQYK